MPLVTLLLVLANLAAYRLEIALGGQPVCDAFGLVPARFNQAGSLEPVFTALFLHDPASLGHLVGNMAFLLVFGVLVERELGSLAFAALYAAAGLAGGLLHVLVDPSSTTPLVGASGAIFGVLAVAAALRPRLLGFAFGFAGLNVWYALTGGAADVSFGAHLGGFAAGVLAAAVLRCAGHEAFELEVA